MYHAVPRPASAPAPLNAKAWDMAHSLLGSCLCGLFDGPA